MNIGYWMLMLATCLYHHGDAYSGDWYQTSPTVYEELTYTPSPPKVSTTMTSHRIAKAFTSHTTTEPPKSHIMTKPSTEPGAEEDVTSEYLDLPPWMLYAEVSSIVVCLLIVFGLLACCCLKLFGFSITRNRRKKER